MIDFSPIKGLFFDFGCVLVNLDKQRCLNNFYTITGCDFSDVIGNYVQAGVFLQLEKGLISTDDFCDEVRKYSNYPITNQQIIDAWCSFLLDVPEEKKQLLRELRKQFSVFMLSNTNRIHIDRIMDENFGPNGSDYFDKCYLSCEIHLAKPDRAIFEYVLNDSGFKAEECLLLDDGEKNLEVAEALGFHTCLVKPYEDLKPVFANILK
jgi:putative hydrolase of the HAD superfamily